jgi:hypothetical protein
MRFELCQRFGRSRLEDIIPKRRERWSWQDISRRHLPATRFARRAVPGRCARLSAVRVDDLTGRAMSV